MLFVAFVCVANWRETTRTAQWLPETIIFVKMLTRPFLTFIVFQRIIERFCWLRVFLHLRKVKHKIVVFMIALFLLRFLLK